MYNGTKKYLKFLFSTSMNSKNNNFTIKAYKNSTSLWLGEPNSIDLLIYFLNWLYQG